MLKPFVLTLPAVLGALRPQSTGPPGLPEVLMYERGHLLERLLCNW
jgi:hypothetical protein